MTDIISLTGSSLEPDAQGYNQAQLFGYYKALNLSYRSQQEDTLVFHTLTPEELTPPNPAQTLTPTEIGHRLWTTYQLLDKKALSKDVERIGTTATTTVYDGKGNIITAQLADSAVFAAIYDKNGRVLGVVRLNKQTHKPTEDNQSEVLRIQNCGGYVFRDRVNGNLAVSRAIGDKNFQESGVCSEAHIDINNIDTIISTLKIKPELVGSFQIITTSDGFTDGSNSKPQTPDSEPKKTEKTVHEDYLFKKLSALDSPGHMTEEELAHHLIMNAMADGSKDNTSIAINTITSQSSPRLLGMYDGHGGQTVSDFVAMNIGETFKKQCALSQEAYEQQEFSVIKKAEAYARDNTDAPKDYNAPPMKIRLEQRAILDPRLRDEYVANVKKLTQLTEKYRQQLNVLTRKGAKIAPVLDQLIQLLKNKNPQTAIKQFYEHLYAPYNNSKSHTSLEIIRQDNSKSTLHFLAGITIVIGTILTGVLLGALIMSIAYAATDGKALDSFIDLFSSKSERFEKEISSIRRNLPNFFAVPSSTPQISDEPKDVNNSDPLGPQTQG